MTTMRVVRAFVSTRISWQTVVTDGTESDVIAGRYLPNPCAADALIDWERRISVALMRSVGCRLLGGGVDFLFAKEGGNGRGVRENDETEGLGEDPDLGGVIVYR